MKFFVSNEMVREVATAFYSIAGKVAYFTGLVKSLIGFF